jgi:hypothetical protein
VPVPVRVRAACVLVLLTRSRIHHAIDLAIRAVEQARAEYLRGRVDPLRSTTK